MKINVIKYKKVKSTNDTALKLIKKIFNFECIFVKKSTFKNNSKKNKDKMAK